MDTFATAVLSLLAVVAAGGALIMSPFLVMATDSAGATGDKPRFAALWWAFAIIWGGVAAAVIGAAFGIVKAAHRHTTMWVWPAGAIALIGGCFALGVFLATKVVRAEKPLS